LDRTHYQVPRGDQQFLFEPSVAASPAAVAQNRDRYNADRTEVWGRPLAIWREAARRECLNRAVCYTSQLDGSDCSPRDASRPLIATGHQPELFHPGVWAKNILVDDLARRCDGYSLNLIVDSDIVKGRSITVPTRKRGALQRQRVVVDEWPLGMPWQEVRVRDAELFRTFANRVTQWLPALEGRPVIELAWQAVVETTERTDDLVAGLTVGRRVIEADLGICNLEVPVSHVAQTASFREFAAGLLLDATDLADCYNASLARYRQTYQLKSSSHPMPDLERDGDWQEVPLWGWETGDWRRHPLYCRRDGNQLTLSDREDLSWTAEVDPADPLKSLSSTLAEWMAAGGRIRPRALMTTLFMRLFVSDWFVHGIGGAKYDEITDEIVRCYFQVEPPRFQVATGTRWLPLEQGPETTNQSVASLEQSLRYGEENPETLLEESERNSAEVRALLAEKQRLIDEWEQRPRTGLTRSERKARRPENRKRHRRLAKIRKELRQFAEAKLNSLREQLRNAQDASSRMAVASNREYAFLCYPTSTLRDFAAAIRERH